MVVTSNSMSLASSKRWKSGAHARITAYSFLSCRHGQGACVCWCVHSIPLFVSHSAADGSKDDADGSSKETGRIVYDDEMLDKLLDRTQQSNVAVVKDGLNEYFSAFKVRDFRIASRVSRRCVLKLYKGTVSCGSVWCLACTFFFSQIACCGCARTRFDCCPPLVDCDRKVIDHWCRLVTGLPVEHKLFSIPCVTCIIQCTCRM